MKLTSLMCRLMSLTNSSFVLVRVHVQCRGDALDACSECLRERDILSDNP